MTENKEEPGNRFDSKRFGAISINEHWSDIVADEVIKKFPDLSIYTCAAGISPSGIVHFGNLRDVMTVYAVVKALERKGKKTRTIFSWDNFDRFRKVPAGTPKELIDYIGQPLTSVPDLIGNEFSSYAERYQAEFEKTLAGMGIKTEFIYQTNEYNSGRYGERVDIAMRERKTIAKTLYGFMTDIGKSEKEIVEEDYVNSYYPLSVYSKFNNTDATEITSYENFIVTYTCLKTGNTDSFDIREPRKIGADGKPESAGAKLSWKSDWPMRWGVEGVVFEPGGHDHASPGGSYDVSATLAREVFNIEPPVFVGYQFIGLQGLKEKMSGSKGNAITPKQLLEIYEPALLKWLYMRSNPHQVFNLSFDSEIIRQYDEFDSIIRRIQGKSDGRDHKEGAIKAIIPATPQDTTDIEMAFQKDESTHEKSIEDARLHIQNYNSTSFRLISNFGQIVNWDFEKMLFILNKNEVEYDNDLLKERMKKAKAWLEIYNTDQFITVLAAQNSEYIKTLDDETVGYVKRVVEYLQKQEDAEINIEELEVELYAIPRKDEFDQKQKAHAQRAFFKHVYHLLIGKDTGPRLATFMWAIGKEKVIGLLDLK